MDKTIVISVFVVAGIAIMYSFWMSLSDTRVTVKQVSVQETYDYIIVGGGTAGSVIGSRLSEDINVTVLILEAGNHHETYPDIKDPSKAMFLQHSAVDWNYMSAEDSSFNGLRGHTHFITSGRVLGGSSAINYNIYVRGSPFHFDEWVTTYGGDGWGYKDMLPYFKKCESMEIERFKNSDYHGVNGPIAVSELPVPEVVYNVFLTAAKQLGYDEVDYNGQSQSGFGPIQYSIRNGQRSSASSEYLNINLIDQRQNVDISVNSVVTKIDIIDKVARGVYFIKNNKKQYVKIKREIIVSAGALKSPQVLMLSGIGPQKHLKELNIPVVVDVPVGLKLNNHVAVAVHVKCDISVLHNADEEDLISKIGSFLFGASEYGPFVTNGFLHTDPAAIGKEKPDLQMVLTQTIFDTTGLYNYDQSVRDIMRKSYQNETGFTAIIFLTQPKSFGNVKLNTADPFDHPRVHINQLSNDADVKALTKGIRLLEKITLTDSLKELKPDLGINEHSFCSDHVFKSDEYWECFIRYTAFISHHYSTTCRMGPAEDQSSVVDLSLKVKGVDNLRVCDASVFPSVTTGNTYAPVLAVAEKLADMIKNKAT
ncbi:hypothetical protein ACF0H5_013528 [Mactra antiquata]